MPQGKPGKHDPFVADAIRVTVTAPSSARAPLAGGTHPLERIHRIVEQACADRRDVLEQAGAAQDGSVIRTENLVRAALLQSLYSYSCNEQLMEQLRYNALYRGFVGMPTGIFAWNAGDYARALDRLRHSATGGVLFREVLAQVHAFAALMPGRFRIDAALTVAWMQAPLGSQLEGGASRRDPDELCFARLERARAVILRRIGDPALCPDKVATELCMSRRALYLMFEKHGLTPTRAIREIRLDCCRKLLADARHRHRKITDIAMDYGFEDPGSFSRQFKARYGMSPREARVGGRLAKDGPERYLPPLRTLSAAS